MKKNATFKQSLFATLLLSLYGLAQAGTVGTLNTFSASTTASASQVNSNFSTVTSAVNDNASRLTTVETSVSGLTTTVAGKASKPTGAVYRWAVFSTYSQLNGWYGNNSATFFGGVLPSVWTDGNGLASGMSADKEVLRTLYTQKGYGGKNAVVYADEWYSQSSTNGKIATALFRIKNTTASPITWTPIAHFTSYTGWGEMASVALNGVSQWTSGSTDRTPVSGGVSISMSIPASQTSTAIFVSTSTNASGTRSTFLAFSGDSLVLPAGLEYVDDLDTATGGWTQ